jgi:hypothetical protein
MSRQFSVQPLTPSPPPMRLSATDPDLWKTEVMAETANIRRIRTMGATRVREIAEGEGESRAQTARAQAARARCEEARKARASAMDPARKEELKGEFNAALAEVETAKGRIRRLEKDLDEWRKEESNLRVRFVEEVMRHTESTTQPRSPMPSLGSPTTPMDLDEPTVTRRTAPPSTSTSTLPKATKRGASATGGGAACRRCRDGGYGGDCTLLSDVSQPCDRCRGDKKKCEGWVGECLFQLVF